MISYFKYTNGDVFTLDGQNYQGMFHVENGVAYTGRIQSIDTKILQASNTFAADVYLSTENFNRTISSVVEIDPINIIPMGILNKTSRFDITVKLDDNNREIYKSKFITPINEITNFTDAKFYGVSATPVDFREPDDLPLLRDVYSQIDPFSYTDDMKFLDDIVDSHISIADDRSFLYYVNTKTNSYVLSGSVVENNQLTIVSNTPFESNVYTATNESTGILYQIGIDTNIIKLFDLAAFNHCGEFIRIDEIEVNLPDNLVFTGDNKIKVGNNLFAVGAGESSNKTTHIVLFDMGSSEVFNIIPLSDIDITNLTDFDIRSEDDALIIVSSDRVVFIDTALSIISNWGVLISEEIVDGNVGSTGIVTFSTRDSNVFYLTSTNDFQLRYIDNPRNIASVVDMVESLKFLRDYLFDNTHERFSKIQIKFNSNKLKSNYPNIQNVVWSELDGAPLMIIHFIGRIYFIPINLSTDIKYRNDIALQKNYTEGDICNNTYIGMSINMALRSILDDTINIYNNYSKIATSNNGIVFDSATLRSDLDSLEDVDFNIHENESVNIVVLQRVIASLYDIQKSLVDDINSSVIS